MLAPLPLVPSPKFHWYDVMLPVEVAPLKLHTRLVQLDVNAAFSTGGGPATMLRNDAVTAPQAPPASRARTYTVCLPTGRPAVLMAPVSASVVALNTPSLAPSTTAAAPACQGGTSR